MILLDSSFIIDFIRNDQSAVNKLDALKDNVLFTTGINVFEVFFGLYAKDRKKDIDILKEFFNNLTIINLDYKSAMTASKIGSELSKTGKIIELNDILIAGMMLANGCNSILTRNKEHFSRIKGLNVISY